MILSICNNSSVLGVIRLFKICYSIISIAVPIILLVSCMLCFTKAIAGENDLSKTLKTIVTRSIASVVLLLLPTFVGVIINLTGGNDEYVNCIKNATTDKIAQLKEVEQAKKEAAKKEMEEKQEKADEEKENSQELNAAKINTSAGSSNSTLSVANIGCPLYFGSTVVPSIRINSALKENILNILTEICAYTNRNSFIGKLSYAGGYTEKSGYHGLGQAIDIWSDWEYTENDGSYSPYRGQGTRTWNNYKKFICKVCNGKEDCSKNINYQIYKLYFRPSGWCWGGNWSENYFDPMHYEYNGSSCGLPSSNRITCD